MKIAGKKLIGVLFVLGLLSLMVGMSMLENSKRQQEEENNVSDGDKIKVAATIFPLYDIVRTVGGDKVDAKLVLSPGASPHTFEVTPGQVKDFQSVQTFFVIGHGIDDWTNDIATSVDGAEVFIVDENISLIPFEHEEHEGSESEHEHEHEGSEDPHYWLSLKNAEQISKNVAEKLSLMDPENADYYKRNSENFVNELETRRKQWQDKVIGLENRDLVVFHDAWGYFAKDFDFNIVATFEPFPGKSPSPQYLAELETEVKEKNIKALFVEPQFSEDSISTLANDLNVDIEVIDPIGGVSGRESYIDLIDFNVNAIYSVLK